MTSEPSSSQIKELGAEPARLPDRSDLPVERNWEHLHRALSRHVNSQLSLLDEARIVEAGCGRRWSLNLPDTNFRLIGVDLDKHALEIRLTEKKDLDEAIVGDLQDIELPLGSFDMVYSSYVLEHIENADLLAAKMLDWIRPGGLLVLKIPVRESVFGFFTRITPLWLHVLYHRYVLRVPDAGKPGHSPYPTYYDSIVSVEGMRKFIEDNSLDVLFAAGTEFGVSKIRLVQTLYETYCTVISFVTLGRLTNRFSGLALVLIKPS